MKIQFDSNQEYQTEAVSAIVDLFAGQPLKEGAFELSLTTQNSGGSLFQTELGVGNKLLLNEDTLAANLRAVQERNKITSPGDFAGMHFSVEMETGTGKTYVYLRTINELYTRYGFSKFIIVVPSVAIREGVLKNLEITEQHFRNLYGNIPLDYFVYDSKKVSRLRHFAAGNQVQVLIINIDAFNKKTNNVIFQAQDKLSGRKPIEFIQATRPIVIIDEPQNMESDKAKEAITSLAPLCTLRYSATHRNLYNLVYRLDPVKAYDMRLVKQIQVNSVISEEDYNQAFLRLESIHPAKARISAKLSLHVHGSSGPKLKTIQVKAGEDLFYKSNQRAVYREGYVINEINAGDGYISFSNGKVLYLGQSEGGLTDDIMRTQIKETVKDHFEKERQVKGKGIKVLSLFFIDRVANYRYYENGRRYDGKLALWFKEAFAQEVEKPVNQELITFDLEQVHAGYFSQDRRGMDKDTSGKTQVDDDTYNLIMRNKERLLSLDEPVRFIFSHSALREGWDNPNVFQICTLNETRSELKKRQEIGRGLRLPVNQDGYRVFDENINRLTVIANENYEAFAQTLQQEIEDECGVDFSGRIKNKRERRTAKLKKGFHLDEDFKALWERIKHKTRYAVEYQAQELITKAAALITGMPPVIKPRIKAEKVQLEISAKGVESRLSRVREDVASFEVSFVPDILGYLQRETELTRSTLTSILVNSGRLGEIYVNPQQFMDGVLKEIKMVLHQFMINGIKYEKIDGQEYEMLLFEQKEIENYLNNMVDVRKSIYDSVVVESGVERDFARELDGRDDIKLFVKLPHWFKVATPIGTYNPDWAIVKEADQKVYLIRETKATREQEKLHPSEVDKIKCGAKHFDSLSVDFKVVTSAREV